MPGGNFTRNTAAERDDSIARKMFCGGLLGLPWLWAVNVWFYRKHLFGSGAGVDPGVQYCECERVPPPPPAPQLCEARLGGDGSQRLPGTQSAPAPLPACLPLSACLPRACPSSPPSS